MSEKKSGRKTWIIVIVVFLVLVTGYFAYTLFQLAQLSGNTPCETFTLDFLMVSLPPNATILDESCEKGFNPTYKVAFVMPSDELTVFQQQNPVSEIDEWRSDTSNSFISEESWQEVREELQKEGAQLQTLQYGEFGNGSILLSVLIDVSDDQQYFVQYSASYVD